MNTEMGKIAHALTQAQEGKTPLQLKLIQLSKFLTMLVLAICIVIFAVSLIRAESIDGNRSFKYLYGLQSVWQLLQYRKGWQQW